MSYTEQDAMWDEAYEAMSRELYPEHREQAIAEFTAERLRSYYLKQPDVAVNAVRSYKEAEILLANGHPSASFVFAASAIEQYLKAALLKPVVFGLVHTEAVAALIVDLTVCQNGFLDRYKKLLSRLFISLANVDISAVQRSKANKKLLEEVKGVQEKRNEIIHRGVVVGTAEAQHALDVAKGFFTLVLVRMLTALRLQIVSNGDITEG